MLKSILIFTLLFSAPVAYANVLIDKNKLADAIFKAEGVKSKHPYGILKRFKHTTPRQACLNTIQHAIVDFKGNSDDLKGFIKFLGSRYCPVGAKNDPRGLNKNWIRNTTKFYFNG